MAESQAGTGKPPVMRPRPLSPHLQIYGWKITMAASITHRITGVGLGIGSLLLTCWLLALAAGPESYTALQAFLGSWFGRLLLLGFTWSLMYHLCNGVRHLFWDTGRGFEIATANRTAWAAFVGSVLLTLIVWVLAYSCRGAI
ncbi:MAG: succinate dehydrogenase / fumarate reductase, cytochrome b subunit [Alphaproteobacteria bacterium]|nr:succinate dehydrogenase / fumarate reductase, cytochrome b subunit [Alphaproteobacteria bacterium]